MTTKENIEKLRDELISSIEASEGKGLTKIEVVELSQRLDEEITRFYSVDKEKSKKERG